MTRVQVCIYTPWAFFAVNFCTCNSYPCVDSTSRLHNIGRQVILCTVVWSGVLLLLKLGGCVKVQVKVQARSTTTGWMCWHGASAFNFREQKATTVQTGWFKLKDWKLFLGQSPLRFFESDREILDASSMRLLLIWAHTKTWVLTGCFFLFSRGFSSVNIFWEIWTSLDQLDSVKKHKQEENLRLGLGMDVQNTCAKL